MKETKNNIKETVEKALQEVVKKRKEKLGESSVETFAILNDDEIGELHEFENLSDVIHPETCPSLEEPELELHEEDIVPDEMEGTFVSTESLLDIAEEIKPLDANNIILCDVGGTERILVNGENCNIIRIPLLNLVLLTPPNLEIVDNIMISGNASVYDEIELTVIFSIDDKRIMITSDIRSLTTVGLLTVLVDDEEELIPTYSCSAIEWRGIVTKISLEELELILNN